MNYPNTVDLQNWSGKFMGTKCSLQIPGAKLPVLSRAGNGRKRAFLRLCQHLELSARRAGVFPLTSIDFQWVLEQARPHPNQEVQRTNNENKSWPKVLEPPRQV